MKTQNITDEQALIYKMLTENTGKHFLDSGYAYGRHWQKNKAKTIEDFISEDEATLYISKRQNELMPEVYISLFHYLSINLELDSICQTFNALPCDNWDSDMFGVSKEGREFLENIDATILNDYNSYNWNSPLSQVIQYTLLDIDGTNYVTLQVHGGCDVRGGYTDAKLFMACEFFGYEAASFEISRGQHRLIIDYKGEQLETYGGEWIHQNIDLEEALAEFGEGKHIGYLVS